MTKLPFILLLISCLNINAQFLYDTEVLNLHKQDMSIHGLSVVDDSVIWISGSNGWFGRSLNRGKSWNTYQVTDFETANFNSIYAFDGERAVFANTGSPARIFLTENGGKSLTYSYRNSDPQVSIAGIDFRNKNEGFAYGAPINGEMLVLKTTDAGVTWNTIKGPALEKGETVYAASGTGMRLVGKQGIVIATFGTNARIITSEDNGKTWNYYNTPATKGSSTTGIFSVACLNMKEMVIAFGNLNDSLSRDNIRYTKDGGKTWIAPDSRYFYGFSECVEFLNERLVNATGPQGCDDSTDKGKTWSLVSEHKNYHVTRKARKGKLIVQGGEGKVKLVFISLNK
jgi:photosystem II stability/assembly factor-like uncharacterized protein